MIDDICYYIQYGQGGSRIFPAFQIATRFKTGITGGITSEQVTGICQR